MPDNGKHTSPYSRGNPLANQGNSGNPSELGGGQPDSDLVNQLLDRCEVTHFSEIYERIVDRKGGAVPFQELWEFNRIFTPEKIRNDINRHPNLLVAHPPGEVKSGEIRWMVVDYRVLKDWIKSLFAIAYPNRGEQGNLHNYISLQEIATELGVSESEQEMEKLDFLLERASTLPGLFLQRIEDPSTIQAGGMRVSQESYSPTQVRFQMLSHLRKPGKRKLLYQLLGLSLIFIISLSLLIPILVTMT